MYLFGVKLKLLPSMGSGDFKHIILPSLALAFWMASLYIRRVRGSMLEEMNKDYLNGGLPGPAEAAGCIPADPAQFAALGHHHNDGRLWATR